MTAASTRVPAVGDPAPDFTLPSTAGGTVTLSAFRGKQQVLLAFFPAAFTSVCTAELCGLSEDFDAFTGRDTVVFPISVDMVPSLKEFKAKHAMKVELLSDFRREVSAAYGVLLPDRLVANRSYFLVGTDGAIRWAHVEEHGGYRRENAELLAAIDAAR